jgi:hypothetical protein
MGPSVGISKEVSPKIRLNSPPEGANAGGGAGATALPVCSGFAAGIEEDWLNIPVTVEGGLVTRSPLPKMRSKLP